MLNNMAYTKRFYTLELMARGDGTVDPIEWKPYYDKIELIIYIADVRDYIKTRRVSYLLLSQSSYSYKHALLPSLSSLFSFFRRSLRQI